MLPPFWSLGFHLCRWGYGTIEGLLKIIQVGKSVNPDTENGADFSREIKMRSFRSIYNGPISIQCNPISISLMMTKRSMVCPILFAICKPMACITSTSLIQALVQRNQRDHMHLTTKVSDEEYSSLNTIRRILFLAV